VVTLPCPSPPCEVLGYVAWLPLGRWLAKWCIFHCSVVCPCICSFFLDTSSFCKILQLEHLTALLDTTVMSGNNGAGSFLLCLFLCLFSFKCPNLLSQLPVGLKMSLDTCSTTRNHKLSSKMGSSLDSEFDFSKVYFLSFFTFLAFFADPGLVTPLFLSPHQAHKLWKL